MKQVIATPWGESDEVTKLCDGLYFVSREGYGGFKVEDRWINNQIPIEYRIVPGWYDGPTAHAVIAFSNLFPDEEVIESKKIVEEKLGRGNIGAKYESNYYCDGIHIINDKNNIPVAFYLANKMNKLIHSCWRQNNKIYDLDNLADIVFVTFPHLIPDPMDVLESHERLEEMFPNLYAKYKPIIK